MAFRRIASDHTCPGLVPERELRVAGLRIVALVGDGGGGEVRVEYTIVPPLPPRGRGEGMSAWPVVWTWGAADDVGTTYEEAGGGYGPRGDRTEGDLTLRPAPPPEARRLRVFLRPWFPWADPQETFRECVVEVDLTAAEQ
jgi:hypothetical protein